MIRSSRLLRLVFPVVLIGLVTVGSGATLAQDGTPNPGPPPPQPGVTFTGLGYAPGVAVPNPADLIVVRIEVEPGAVSPFDANDPTGAMLVVESGAFTIRADGVDWTISRNGALDATMATPDAGMDAALETVADGEDATLEAGDVAWVPGSVGGEFRNDGDVPAVGLAFLIAPGGMTGQ